MKHNSFLPQLISQNSPHTESIETLIETFDSFQSRLFEIKREDLPKVVQHLSEGVLLINDSGEIEFANKTASRLFKKTIEELESSHFWFPLDNSTSTEINITHKDNTEAILEMRVSDVEINGKQVHLASFRDVTKRRQTENVIAQESDEWMATFNAIPDLISIHDTDFKIIRANKAFEDYFGIPWLHAIGQVCYRLVHDTDECLENCPHKRTLETGEPSQCEHYDAHIGAFFEIRTYPLRNGQGDIYASIHIMRDISEKKKMDEQLMVTDRLASIGELASGIAHELNNPLTSVIGFSDMLLKKEVPPDMVEQLEIINKEARRSSEVVKNLLVFARRKSTEKKTIDVNSLIEEVLKMRSYEHKVNSINVETVLDPDLPRITGDRFQIQQVIINLVINAEFFMVEANGRGILSIITESNGNTVQIHIADNGPGIIEEYLGQIFNPFFTTKEVGKGTGLGLSICHGIIKDHQGSIKVESVESKGTSFIIELPVTTGDAEETL